MFSLLLKELIFYFNLHQTLIICIGHYWSKYQPDQCVHWVSITAQTNVPSFYKIAFQRVNQEESNSHITRCHECSQVKPGESLKCCCQRRFVVCQTRFLLRKLRFSYEFQGLSATECTLRCDFTKWGYLPLSRNIFILSNFYSLNHYMYNMHFPEIKGISGYVLVL